MVCIVIETIIMNPNIFLFVYCFLIKEFNRKTHLNIDEQIKILFNSSVNIYSSNKYNIINNIMNVDFNLLLNKANQSQIIILFDQWSRLKNLLGDQKAFELLLSLLESNTLDILKMLSDEDITSQFNIKKSQNPQINSPQQEKQSPQKLESEQQRIKRQTHQSLKQYSPFCDLTGKALQGLIKKAFSYKTVKNIISKSNIISAVNRLKNKSPSQSNIFDFLEVVDSALYYSTDKYRLRETQILALLLFLIAGSRRMLLQILTGEGKSTTVSCLAAILTISGLTVDIVTTSQLLAERDVQEKKQFFRILGLRVAHNFQQNQKNEKGCYQKNTIVYGTPNSFQVDILLHDYKKRGTRGRRPFEVLIVDEVDSMFIDQKQHQTLLASVFPGFYQLVKPMKLIWNKICSNPIIIQDDKKIMAMSQGQKIITGQVKLVMQEVIKEIRQKFKDTIIPQWRMQFINESLQKWIQSAIAAAFVYKRGKQYLVKQGKIIPYDYKNNGSAQQNVQWQNGLHQFLQIKHDLEVSTEGMTSNFISNLGHFDKYKYLFGLTGTMGSNQSKEFLRDTYRTNLFKVPPFRVRRLQINPGMVLYDQIDWAKYICETIQNMIACKRSVLVLCESIQEVQLIKLSLGQMKKKAKQLQTLAIGDQSINENIGCSEIFLATNLAGRGADLKISEQLNKNGGLHVIISFMPINSRVQMQGRGRAGRNGFNGSSQLAINFVQYCQEYGIQQSRQVFQSWGSKLIEKLQETRENIQMKSREEQEKNVRKLRAKDQIFTLFCESMNRIPDYQSNFAKQKALQQQWAMFLKRIQNQQLPDNILIQQAKQLINNLCSNSDNFYNGNHQVDRGVNKLCDRDNNGAIKHFKQAIKIDGTLPQIFAGTLLGSCTVNANKGNKQKMQQGYQNFHNAREHINKRIELSKAQRIYDIPNHKITDFFNKQDNKKIEDFSANFSSNNINKPIPTIKKIDNISVDQSYAKVKLPQERILSALDRKIQIIMQKFKNLGKNEHIQFRYLPSKSLLQICEGDPEENKQALKKMQDQGLGVIPEGHIVKNEVPLWKRCLVFVLGVCQVIIGGLIITETGGALSGLGINFVYEGLKDCYNAIFQPEQISDLSQYFTEKAISYAISLTFAGLSACGMLGATGHNGFQMIPNLTMQQFLKKVAVGGIKTLICKGVSHLMKKPEQKDNSLTQNLKNPIRQVLQNKEFIKKQVQKMASQQKKLDETNQVIINNYKKQISSYVSKYVLSIRDSILPQIKSLNFSRNEIDMIISQSLKDSLKQSSDNQKDGKKLQVLFSKHIKQAQNNKNFKMDNLAKQFMKTISLQSRVKELLQNITANENYKIVIKNGFRNMMVQSINKTIQQKKAISNTEQASIQAKRNQLKARSATLLASQAANHNQQVSVLNQRIARHNQSTQRWNAAITNLDINELYDLIKGKSGIQKGRMKEAVIRSLNVHQYIKQALLKLQYPDSSRSFQQIIQTAIGNSIGNYGQMILKKILQSTEGSVEKISKIADLIFN